MQSAQGLAAWENGEGLGWRGKSFRFGFVFSVVKSGRESLCFFFCFPFEKRLVPFGLECLLIEGAAI